MSWLSVGLVWWSLVDSCCVVSTQVNVLKLECNDVGSTSTASSAAVIGAPSKILQDESPLTRSGGSLDVANVGRMADSRLSDRASTDGSSRIRQCATSLIQYCLFVEPSSYLKSGSRNSEPEALAATRQLRWWGHRSWTPQAGREHHGEGTGDPVGHSCCRFVCHASCYCLGCARPSQVCCLLLKSA